MNPATVARYLDDIEYLNAPRNRCLYCGSYDTQFEDRLTRSGHRAYTLYCQDCNSNTRVMLKNDDD